MSRLIALLVVFGGIYWLWQRWQRNTLNHSGSDPSQNRQSTKNQRLTQCPRCDAMLPESSAQQKVIAESCDQGEHCPLRNNS